jgi:DNA-binding MarR family transcriptional regulator
VTAWDVRLDRARGPAAIDASATSGDGQEFVITESLGYLVNRVARSMAHQLAEVLAPAGIGIGQWAVLLFLWSRDGMSQAELSRQVAIEPPTMVRTIDRMERDGLVTRVREPTDGRISRVRLTERGRALRDELVPKAVAVNARNLARMTDAEARTLHRVLRRLIDPPLDERRAGGSRRQGRGRSVRSVS